MSLFMKRGAGGASMYPPRIACYVCGAEVPADYPLFPEPSPPSPPPPSLASAAAIMSKPHFPFLMHHPPPMGCRPPSPGGVAKSCRVCYSDLMRQWDEYENQGVPTDKRVYWLKRIDGLGFASPEIQAQAAAEVRARVLGMFHQHPRSPHLRTASPAGSLTHPAAHLIGSLINTSSPGGAGTSGAGVPIHELTPEHRIKASSPLTIVTPGTGSISPMATPNSHPGGGGGPSASSSLVGSAVWSSRSAIISGEPRPGSRHSPLVIDPHAIHGLHHTVHGVHSVHGPKTTVHQQVVAAATAASMAAEHGSSSSNRVAQAAGPHHHHHPHPHHPHVPAVSAAAPHGPHGVIQSHPGVVHSHPSTTAVVHVLPPPPQTTVVQVTQPQQPRLAPPQAVVAPPSASGAVTVSVSGTTSASLVGPPPSVSVSAVSTAGQPGGPSAGPSDGNDSALDLSSGSRQDRETKSRSSVVSQHSSYQSSDQSSSTSTAVTDILDLTLPDKNATFEVCYLCGDDFKKGTLTYIFAKQMTDMKEPFYPSLRDLARPPRSRPMDSAGRVQTCDECHDHLLAQWNTFEDDEDEAPPHHDRKYVIRKQQTPMVDTATFVCYICALDYHASSLRLLYARPNSDSEPYYPSIEQQRPPPGASPISPQGMVQVCTLCSKSTKERHHGFMSTDQPPPKKRRGMAVAAAAAGQGCQGSDAGHAGPGVAGGSDNDPDAEKNALPADLTCPLCRRKFSFGNFRTLYCQPPPAGGVPYYPFLAELSRPEELMDKAEELPRVRVLACSECTEGLHSQWAKYQGENVPIEERNYFYQSLIGPRSSQQHVGAGAAGGNRPHTPSSIRSHRSGSDRVRSERANTVSAVGDPSSAADSKRDTTRPRSNSNPAGVHGGASPGTGAQQNRQCISPCQPGYAGSAGGTSESAKGGGGSKNQSSDQSSSFCCFLCGLHSELTFARNLYCKAPGKKAPYFPFMKRHVPKARAETLREDDTALVCTFCYHTVMAQWSRYSATTVPRDKYVEPENRTYNLVEYICYVCGVMTYRKRIRALAMVDFPFLRNHKAKKGVITMENNEMVAVCLDCYDSLRSQFSEGVKYGIPVDKRRYNWISKPPPPVPGSSSNPDNKTTVSKATLPPPGAKTEASTAASAKTAAASASMPAPPVPPPSASKS